MSQQPTNINSSTFCTSSCPHMQSPREPGCWTVVHGKGREKLCTVMDMHGNGGNEENYGNVVISVSLPKKKTIYTIWAPCLFPHKITSDILVINKVHAFATVENPYMRIYCHNSGVTKT